MKTVSVQVGTPSDKNPREVKVIDEIIEAKRIRHQMRVAPGGIIPKDFSNPPQSKPGTYREG